MSNRRRATLNAMADLAAMTTRTPIAEVIEARKRVRALGEAAGMCMQVVPDLDVDSACVAPTGHDWDHVDNFGRAWGR